MTASARVITAGLALALVSGCTATQSATHSAARPSRQPLAKAALVAFDSCADLVASMRSALKTSRATMGAPGLAGPAAPGPAAPEGRAPAAAGGDVAHSTTNTAESTVDEPDLVKTDGRRIVTVYGRTLRIVDPATRQVTGTLALPGVGGSGLLLFGDHALVAVTQTLMPLDGPAEYPVTQRLLLVDLVAPRILSTYEMDGWLVDARQVGPIVRAVVASTPRLRSLDGPFSAADLLPRYSVSTGDATVRGQVDCRAVSRPDRYSGASMLTILTLDLSRPELGSGDPVTIAADASTVYSNGPSLYLAGPSYAMDATQLYAFDTSGTGPPRYLAAGSVPGLLLNQYALSEWRGDLRVATTHGDSSSVYVLRRSGGLLTEVGGAGGLGKGQRVYGVRFAGPVGYVVTFRQMDPLYTVDLRDPYRPAVTGALELTGYSAYLHPVGDGQLIGVGQEADAHGRPQGAQVSLFDVRDPAAPRRLAHFVLPGSWSMAQFDPHAFLYWPPTGLLAVPVTGRTPGGPLVLRVAGGTITPLPRPYLPGAQALRTLVVDRTLWTVTSRGLAANDLDTMASQAWLPF